MKIKLDENLTTRVTAVLKKLGHDVQTTSEEGLTGKPDDEIWDAARSEKRFLVTQDMDSPTLENSNLERMKGSCCYAFIPPTKWRSSPKSLSYLRTMTQKRGSFALLWRPNTRCAYSARSLNI
jgi:hypothetical protein